MYITGTTTMSEIAIAEFTNSINASIAKGLLESNGFACRTNDSALNSLYPVATSAYVQLFVAENQAQAAINLLKEHDLI